MEIAVTANDAPKSSTLRGEEYHPNPRHGRGDGNDFTKARSRLRAQVDSTTDAPGSWRPEPGDELLGRFIRIDTRPTAQSQAERVAVIETEDGEHVGAWLFYRVLGMEWDASEPKPGEMVMLERLDDGKRKKDGGAYRRYRVTVDRPGDWQMALGYWTAEKGATDGGS